MDSHFALAPNSLDVSRSRFNRNFNHKTAFNVGEVVPFYVDEVYPGDTFDVNTRFVIRLSTLSVPVMQNLFVDFSYFFVPNRLIMDDWVKVMGENKVSSWAPLVETYVPHVTIRPENPEDYSLCNDTILDYMGLAFDNSPQTSFSVNVLPFRAYALIWNEYYRDENLQDPIYVPTGSADFEVISGPSEEIPASTFAHVGYSPLLKANKTPDYFTTCLPQPQKGPSVIIPIGLVAPVKTQAEPWSDAVTFPALQFNKASDFSSYRTLAVRTMLANNPSSTSLNGVNSPSPEGLDSNLADLAPANLYADLTEATGATVNQFREAVQIQKLYEKDARGGSRYTEILKSHFGVTALDATLQRPQMLGGERVPLNISQVIATAQNDADNTALGDAAAISVTPGSGKSFVTSFTEHGFVIGVCVVRYNHVYSQGIEKFWTRRRRFDYYDPVFANIGEQPVMKQELTSLAAPDAVFGYQEAWADLRYKPNRVSSSLRPGRPDTLAYWHFADNYEASPTLSASWIQEDATNVDRALSVTSSLGKQLIADILVENTTTRVMPLYSIPGLVDHH